MKLHLMRVLCVWDPWLRSFVLPLSHPMLAVTSFLQYGSPCNVCTLCLVFICSDSCFFGFCSVFSNYKDLPRQILTKEKVVGSSCCCLFFFNNPFVIDIAVLVLIFNAAKSCPTMPALFSDHTFRHYAYLRDSLSHLVPQLRVS